MNHLGSLLIFFCWIVLISGIWLLIYFRTSVDGAFESLEYISNEQWYLGGIMRSLHRYGSDAALVVLLLHIVREFSRDTYRLTRWFTWVAGLPLVWIVFLLGISGYWLVWDELAQYIAITSSELVDAIPIFTDKMAANFLRESSLSDRFFTLMAFLQLIGLPIFLVFGIWLHVFRLSRPNITPPRELMTGTLLAMLVIALIVPAESQDKANLALAPQVIEVDWFYLHFYPLVQIFSPSAVWMLLIGISAVLFLAPWLPRGTKLAAAVVDLDNCNGCRRCADDCPYDAISMQARTDGKRYQLEAVVDPDLCTSCGICVGACPTATPFRTQSPVTPGIDLPHLSANNLKSSIDSATVKKTAVISFVCRGSAQGSGQKTADAAVVEVECVGQIPPPYIDYLVSRNLCKQVELAGCTDTCKYRFGMEWTEQRVQRARDPILRRRIDASAITLSWQGRQRDAGKTDHRTSEQSVDSKELRE